MQGEESQPPWLRTNNLFASGTGGSLPQQPCEVIKVNVHVYAYINKQTNKYKETCVYVYTHIFVKIRSGGSHFTDPDP